MNYWIAVARQSALFGVALFGAAVALTTLPVL